MTDRELVDFLNLPRDKDWELAFSLKIVANLPPARRALFERMKDFQTLENAGLLM